MAWKWTATTVSCVALILKSIITQSHKSLVCNHKEFAHVRLIHPIAYQRMPNFDLLCNDCFIGLFFFLLNANAHEWTVDEEEAIKMKEKKTECEISWRFVVFGYFILLFKMLNSQCFTTLVRSIAHVLYVCWRRSSVAFWFSKRQRRSREIEATKSIETQYVSDRPIRPRITMNLVVDLNATRLSTYSRRWLVYLTWQQQHTRKKKKNRCTRRCAPIVITLCSVLWVRQWRRRQSSLCK